MEQVKGCKLLMADIMAMSPAKRSPAAPGAATGVACNVAIGWLILAIPLLNVQTAPRLNAIAFTLAFISFRKLSNSD